MGDAHAQLRSFVERIARLEDEKAGIAGDIKDVKNEAAAQGFDKRVITQMVREYRMDEHERAAQREHEAMCEVYRANLGMLGGTPLGDAARKRFSIVPPPDEPDEAGDAPAEQPEAEAPAPEFPPEDIDAARERGRKDARSGRKVIENPYISDDPRRAAWDEGWCAETGSDGMDIPPAYRRTSPKKPKKGDDQPAREAA